MAKTVVGLFNSMSDAQAVVRDLVGAGFNRTDIGLVAGNEGDRYNEYVRSGDVDDHDVDDAAGGALKGAGTGAAIGGGLGLIAGLAALAIPGFGPVIAAGPIASALAGAGIGAAAGGIIGALTNIGVHEHDAEYFAEGVRRGGVLVTVRAAEDVAERAADIMERHNAEDVEKRSEEWRSSGWKSSYTGTREPISGRARTYGHPLGTGGAGGAGAAPKRY